MLSVVGIQFAPRHQVVADELVRVCRRGGAIGLRGLNSATDGTLHIDSEFLVTIGRVG